MPALTQAHFDAADRLGELQSEIDPKQEALIAEREQAKRMLRDVYRKAPPGNRRYSVIGRKFEAELQPAGFVTVLRMAKIVAAVRKAKLKFHEVFSITLGTLEKILPDQTDALTYKEQSGSRDIVITPLPADPRKAEPKAA